MFLFMVVTKGEISKFPVVFNHTYSTHWIIIPQIPSDRRQIYNYAQHHMIEES
jgi:hypothetical protein